MKRRLLVGLAIAVALFLSIQQPASATPVGLELTLMLDVSGSISASEFDLQKSGYVQAFNSAAVQNAIVHFHSSHSGGVPRYPRAP